MTTHPVSVTSEPSEISATSDMSVASDINSSAIFDPLPPLLPLLLFLPLYLMHCHENSYATRHTRRRPIWADVGAHGAGRSLGAWDAVSLILIQYSSPALPYRRRVCWIARPDGHNAPSEPWKRAPGLSYRTGEERSEGDPRLYRYESAPYSSVSRSQPERRSRLTVARCVPGGI